LSAASERPAAVAEPAPPLATAQQVAATWLRRAIARGVLRPGDRIGQDAAAVQIGVSLIPVREALRMLESEGVIRYVPRRGYFVATLDLAELEEIYRLRRLLETDAIERGLPRVRPEDVRELEGAAAACTAAAAAADVGAQLAENRRFHFALYALAGSETQARLIRMLWDATEAYRAIYYDLPGAADDAGGAHAAIVEAVRAGDVARCVAELDAHREQALVALRALLV
jgi:DNA-binding GntR family transcriptional regulator